MFAVSQDCDTLTKKQSWKAAGGTHVCVQLGWDVAQASAAAAVTQTVIDQVRGQIADASTAGLRVIFEAAPQYRPDWVAAAVPQFKDQNGTLYSGGLGEDVRDWVWSETGRGYLMDFLAKAYGLLQASDLKLIDTIRVGYGYFGENSFPPVGSANPFQWWGFSSPAQTGTGLAVDQTVCPLPGYTPFGSTPLGTVGSTNDLAWVSWFRSAATVRIRSMVDKYRALGWTGNLHVLQPSTGVRSNWPSSDERWREQNAKGCDWGPQMDSYMQVDRTYGWCTWLSQPDFNTPVVNDDDKSPARKLNELAAARGRGSYGWGENAAGALSADLDAMFAPGGAMAAGGGSTGVMWVDWTSLNDGSGGATLSQLAAKIAAYTVP